jgi:hypothetical protein
MMPDWHLVTGIACGLLLADLVRGLVGLMRR